MTAYFGKFRDSWNVEEDGKIGINLFATAVQVWSVRNIEAGKSSSIQAAADAFCCDPLMVIEAVEDSYWMMLVGPTDDYSRLQIQHEGE